MLGDSGPQFLQSLRVPDWTPLYFKLQSRIPDQAWQTLRSISKLGRTDLSHNDYIFIKIGKIATIFLGILQCHIFLFCRETVEALIKDLNRQKDAIKKTGIVVDGRCFKVKFTVTLDYKALITLLKRKGCGADKYVDNLCNRRLDTERCVFCKVIRVGYT
ncbi:unnamed protein product [Pocillopora meandrina]|uniref:Uncharacterized protein n=1 Tax=Pocillopora meandrina TaxID=46732 RepID=A0AAU9XQB9_9CNID|nr:unnamed protein product [Pocillopora meandrina]